MELDIKWVSTQGLKRNENRDFCGIAIKQNASLFIVLDYVAVAIASSTARSVC